MFNRVVVDITEDGDPELFDNPEFFNSYGAGGQHHVNHSLDHASLDGCVGQFLQRFATYSC